jgi:radical SAM protein with 4Fe4S-binding SPASM domain
MKKIKLKPYVIKVKGARNYALYDLLNGNFYTVEPEGNVEHLKRSLKEAGLTFETEGTVPYKINIDLTIEKNSILIRELQIRLNGCRCNNCWDRKKKNSDMRFISEETLQHLKEGTEFIPIVKIRIEADTEEYGKICYILSEYHFKEVELFVEQGIRSENLEDYKKICTAQDSAFKILENGKRNILELNVDIYRFFYNQHFNACLGQQIAIDCGGEIKTCLWSNNILGTICKDNLKDLIVLGIFDEYWELTKDKIDVCRDCEFRYVCSDCRVNDDDSITKKPGFCDYDPYNKCLK